MAEDDQQERRTARRHWPVRVHRLGEAPPDQLGRTTTAEERWAMMAELARDAWAATGRPIPEYLRARIPVRVRRLEAANRPKDVADVALLAADEE